MGIMTKQNAEGVYFSLERLDGADVCVRQDRCIMVRNRNARCTLCSDACASGCISFSNGVLTIDPDRCIGCGTCATVCPTCALEARNPTDSELYSQCLETLRTNGDTVLIACEQAARAAQDGLDGAVVVVCLGRVEESLLVSLAAEGANLVRLVGGACDQCEHVCGYKTALLVEESTNNLLQAWNSPARVSVDQTLGFEPRKPRRSTRAHDEGAVDSGEKPRLPKVMPGGTLPHFIPDRRERLLDALACLGEPDGSNVGARFSGHVDIDVDACSSCRLCATFCPTGAIARFDDPDGTMGLIHTPADCVRCRLCEKVCRHEALRVVEGVCSRDLLDGASQRIELRPVSVHKGTGDSMRDSLRKLLGMEEVFDR